MSYALSPEVLEHVVDAHCHPTDTSDVAMKNLKATICLMSMHQTDQPKVRELANSYPDKVIPYFGFHPWFSHFISLKKAVTKDSHYRDLFLNSSLPIKDNQQKEFDDLLPHLPDPIYLDDALQELRHYLDSVPHSHVGEIGLDKIFRVSHDYYASPRTLTSFNIPMMHQLAVLEAQIDLAVEMRRNISVHSVRAQMPTVELLASVAKKHGERWNNISVDMHSCGLSPQMWKEVQKKHNNVFLSVSTLVNKRSNNYRELILACSNDRILVESDADDLEQCIQMTCEMLWTVADVKGWSIEDSWEPSLSEDQWGAVRKLEENWRIFREANHLPPKTQMKKNKYVEFEEMSSDDNE